MTIPNSASIVLSLLLLLPAAAAWSAIAGSYQLFLEDKGGRRQALAEVHVAPVEAGFSYRIDWDESRFENHFLSMRPFKCLPHPQRMICRLAYPYPLQRLITESDLTDLEYDLLFLHKAPGEYGINAWNGLYYQLRAADGGLIGELRETDLNVLQAPPEEGDLRPIDPQQLYEASENLWPRRILLKPLTSDRLR